LPDRPARAKAKKPKSEAPPLIDIRNFDTMALLNREYDKLNTPKLYDQAIGAYNETLAKWQGQVELARTRAAELRAASVPLAGLNVNSVRDLESITKTINDINVMIGSVQSASDDAAALVNGIEADINTARELEQRARTALTDDINHLKSYVDLGSGAAFAALEPSIREVLSDAAEQYLDYGIIALEALEKIKAMSAARPKTDKPKKAPRAVFRGRDVIFPVRQYPRFYLGILASDFTLDTWNWAFDLRGISSDPDLSGAPVTLALGLTEDGGELERRLGFKGSADFRTAAVQRFSADLSGGGFPLSLGDRLSGVGINGFDGTTAFSLGMSGRADGGASGNGELRITGARLIDPAGTLAQAVDAAVRETSSIEMGIRYTHWTDQDDEFSVSTNIADLIGRAFRRIADAYMRKALDEIERALRERIGQYIDGRLVSREELDTLFQAARGDRAALDQLKNTLNTKKTEFERRVKNAADEAVQQAKDEAKQQSQQTIQDALQGKPPTLQPPSLPGGFRLPGQ
jgi:hypothetical protein